MEILRALVAGGTVIKSAQSSHQHRLNVDRLRFGCARHTCCDPFDRRKQIREQTLDVLDANTEPQQARPDARWDLAVKDVATAIAKATGLAQLGASGGSIMVTASPDMQGKVIQVLNDWRRLRSNNGAIGQSINSRCANQNKSSLGMPRS